MNSCFWGLATYINILTYFLREVAVLTAQVCKPILHLNLPCPYVEENKGIHNSDLLGNDGFCQE